MVLLSPSREELVVMLQVMDKVAASLGLRINASKTEILSIDKDWKEGNVPVQQGSEVVISEGVVKEVSQFKYLGSVLVTDGRLDVELNIRRGKAVGRFKQFKKMWGTKHLSLATKVKCYKAYVLPILLFGSECWSLTKVQSQKLERVHSSCLRSILGVRLSDRHTNEHIRKPCGVATLSAYITANRLRCSKHRLTTLKARAYIGTASPDKQTSSQTTSSIKDSGLYLVWVHALGSPPSKRDRGRDAMQ